MVGNQKTIEEQGELTGFGPGSRSVEGQLGGGSGHGVRFGAEPTGRHLVGFEEEEVVESECGDELAEGEEEEDTL